jgi:hypothetical protein
MVRSTGHVTCIGAELACRIMIGEHKGKGIIGRLRCRWENNIKINLKIMGYEDMEFQSGAGQRPLADSCEYGDEL